MFSFVLKSFKFVFVAVLLASVSSSYAQSIKVFSLLNYYLPGDKGSVIGILPDSLPAAGYRLDVLWDGKMLATAESARMEKAVKTDRAEKKEDHRLRVGIDPEQLPMGTTALQYRITSEDRLVEEGHVDIVRRAARANAVQIDQLTGGLIADGLPFFPFGFYCGPVGDLPEREVVHGFNMIGPYQSNLPATLTERKSYMDRCAQIGVRVQYGVNSLIGGGHNGTKGLDMTDEEKLALLKSEIVAFRDHPALLSWYINDEPDGQGRPPALLEAAYKMIHELDPYHPISIVFMMPSKANDFRHTMDIAMTDPYPIPGPADKVMEDLAAYNRVYRYEKSVWLVPQAFGGQEMWAREPTAQEIRLMTYMGLVSGVKGIQYYVHAAGNSNPQSVSAWSACSDIAVETAQMTGFLLSEDVAPAVHTEDGRILTRAFRYKGNLLVIAVNNENRPKPLSLEVRIEPGAGLGHVAELWFENREVAFEGGHINDIIDGYGTRVYLVRVAAGASGVAGDGGAVKVEPIGASASNLTLNPSFEKIVSPGLPIGSNMKPTRQQKVDPGATFFADPRLSVAGMFSLRLITPVDSGGDKIRLVPMVINKGNSYTVSVYARAKQQDRMPSFRWSIDAMGETHSAVLTDKWVRYGATFTASSTSTNAILSLELLTQGTAWFDLLQVTPDPIIRYEIQADHTAVVSIISEEKRARVRYAFDKKPDNTSVLYQQPFPLKKATTVYAGLFEEQQVTGSQLQVGESQLFIPVNRALGKAVTLAIHYDPHYPAGGNSSLTDGLMGTTAFKDGKWLGFSGKDLNATIDMGEAIKVNEVTTSFLCDPNSGIFLPPVVSVYASLDNQRFELVGEKANTAGNVRGEPYLQKVTIPMKEKTVRYIRVVAKAFGSIPEGYLFKGSTSWLFTDEVLVQ